MTERTLVSMTLQIQMQKCLMLGKLSFPLYLNSSKLIVLCFLVSIIFHIKIEEEKRDHIGGARWKRETQTVTACNIHDR